MKLETTITIEVREPKIELYSLKIKRQQKNARKPKHTLEKEVIGITIQHSSSNEQSGSLEMSP